MDEVVRLCHDKCVSNSPWWEFMLELNEVFALIYKKLNVQFGEEPLDVFICLCFIG